MGIYGGCPSTDIVPLLTDIFELVPEELVDEFIQLAHELKATRKTADECCKTGRGQTDVEFRKHIDVWCRQVMFEEKFQQRAKKQDLLHITIKAV